MSGCFNGKSRDSRSALAPDTGDRDEGALPLFRVDLDLPPAQRWSAVARAHAPALQHMAQWQMSMVDAAGGAGGSSSSSRGSRARKGKKRGAASSSRPKVSAAEASMTQFAAAEAARLLQQMREAGGAVADLAEELTGVAEAAGIPLHALAMLNLQYEAYCACTAVVVPSDGGGLALGRTLDWELPELKSLNIDVHVMSAGKLVYAATTWAGYTGMLTAQRPGRYGMAVNFREGAADDASAASAPKRAADLQLPVGLSMRLALERCADYAAFVDDVASAPTMAPFYCVVVSSQGEAVQLTRSVGGELPRRTLGLQGVQHIIQANMDHWDDNPAHDTQESLIRCQRASELLEPILSEKGFVTVAELFRVLWTHPIYEDGITLYSTVMDPSSGVFASVSDPPAGAPASKPKARAKAKTQRKSKR